MTAPAPHSCVRAGKTQESAGLRHALRDIEETSREATDELRRMLGVLREDSGPSSLSPLSVPEDLQHALAGAVGRACRAGVTVEVGAEPLVAAQPDWAGELRDLPVEGAAISSGASSSPSSEYVDVGSRHG